MSQLLHGVKRFLVSEDGPTAVEYAVMLALIIVVCLDRHSGGRHQRERQVQYGPERPNLADGRDSSGAGSFAVQPFPAERGRLRPRFRVSNRPAIRVTIREFAGIAASAVVHSGLAAA